MDKIFNYDNGFFRGLNKVVDMVILSICWIIACIPVFTIGAASVALYDTARRVIHHDEGYVWSGFWGSFKRNFKQAEKTWIIQLVIILILLGDIYITWMGLKAGQSWGALNVVFIIMALFITAWSIYTFAYVSRFEQTAKITLKNTFLILIANLPWTVVVIFIFGVSLVLLYLLPIVIIILPTAVALAYEWIFERIFRKLMPEEDRLKEEAKDKEYRG